jgi:phosphoglycolate phosphatase-like HAD superfamily hydrolase
LDILFDLDGTLVNCEHRRHYVASKPKNWAAFEKTMHLDTVIEPVAHTLRSLWRSGNTIILCSGRGEQNRKTTERWCDEHSICFDDLYMRPLKDHRADHIIKLELLDRMIADGYNPKMVFDDRASVVAAWRSRGLICAQVAEGNF